MTDIFLTATNMPLPNSVNPIKYFYAGHMELDEALRAIPGLIEDGAVEFNLKVRGKPEEVLHGKSKESS